MRWWYCLLSVSAVFLIGDYVQPVCIRLVVCCLHYEFMVLILSKCFQISHLYPLVSILNVKYGLNNVMWVSPLPSFQICPHYHCTWYWHAYAPSRCSFTAPTDSFDWQFGMKISKHLKNRLAEHFVTSSNVSWPYILIIRWWSDLPAAGWRLWILVKYHDMFSVHHPWYRYRHSPLGCLLKMIGLVYDQITYNTKDSLICLSSSLCP